MKVALVHDWLVNYGGSERCVQAFTELFPEAPIYTSLWDRRSVTEFNDRQIHTSFIQRIPGAAKHHVFYLNLMPTAFERFDLSDYDVVLSSVHACAKGVITLPDTLHICYCHTPTRYVWDFFHRYIKNPSYFGVFNRLIRSVAPFALTYLRLWDRAAIDRVDFFLANSRFIAARIKKYYRRDAEVIYPPVDAKDFAISEEIDDYFLLLSRLVPYKRADLAIQAFNKLKLPLKIAGDGPEFKRLKKLAGDTIEFIGSVDETGKKALMARCRAFIFPPEEDFGITPVEAMAAGRPVIAFGRGGALETVIHGVTGVLFPKQTVDHLIQAVMEFEKMPFDPGVIRAHALQFDRSIFKTKILEFVNRKYQEKQTETPSRFQI